MRSSSRYCAVSAAGDICSTRKDDEPSTGDIDPLSKWMNKTTQLDVQDDRVLRPMPSRLCSDVAWHGIRENNANTFYADLVKLLDLAGIRRAAVFSVAYQFGNPNRPPVSDEYAKVRAENVAAPTTVEVGRG